MARPWPILLIALALATQACSGRAAHRTSSELTESSDDSDAAIAEVAPVEDADAATAVGFDVDAVSPDVFAGDGPVETDVSCQDDCADVPVCSAATCDDGNPCTIDGCNSAAACTHDASAANCEDGNACTFGDACVAGACLPGTVTGCDDGNDCTTDSCDSTVGCSYVPASGACNDGNACTIADACSASLCLAGAATICDDGNPCTDDSCDAAAGCVFLANTVTCTEDGNPCTKDVCAGGVCSHPSKDGWPCDDGQPCTGNDACKSGSCVGNSVVWTTDLPADLSTGTISIIGISWVAPAKEGGWLVTGYFNGNGRVLRVAQTGNILWQVLFTGVPGAATERDSGWAVQFEEKVLLLDPVGATVATFMLPDGMYFGENFKLSAVGKDVIISGIMSPNNVLSLGVHALRIGAAGNLVASKLVAPTGYIGWLASGIQNDCWLASSGNNLWQLVHIDQDLNVLQTTTVAIPGASKWDYFAVSRVTVKNDGSLLLFGDLGYNQKPGHGFVAQYSANADLAWGLSLSWPELGDSDGGTASRYCAVLPDGDIELSGCTRFSCKHRMRWRVAPDGSLRWRRATDEYRLLGELGAEGLGTFAAYIHVDTTNGNYNKFVRLTRNDAFGNGTCAESGTCFDKPASFCDDGNACTNDLCDAAHGGCWHEAFPEATPCKPGMTCKAGVCKP